MSHTLTRLFNLDQINAEARDVSFRYTIVDALRGASYALSSMFVVLYVIAALPPLESSFVLALSMIIIAVIDYPTGGLADTIGHKRVLILAYVFHILFFLSLIFATTFWHFVVAMVLSSIAVAQESGALEAWFDNNYKVAVKHDDPDRTQYAGFRGRKMTLDQGIFGIFLILGGVIAEGFSRPILFAVNIVLLVVILFAIQRFITLKRPVTNEAGVKENNTASFISTLRSGIGFIFSTQGRFFYFFSTSIMIGASVVWGNYLLFPYYSQYSGGNDGLTGLLRSILFLLGVPLTILATQIVKKIKRKYLWFFISNLISGILFFWAAFVYYTLNPPSSGFDLASYVGAIVVFVSFGGMWMSLGGLMYQRLELDLFHDEIRNSLFSLRSSLLTLVSFPIQILVGFIVARSSDYFNIGAGIEVVVIISSVAAIGLVYSLIHLRREELAEIADNQE